MFLTILMTVTIAGLTAGPLANVLGLRLETGEGWVVLGAHELSRVLAHEMQVGGHDVVLVDTNPEHCRIAELEGLYCVNANALDDHTLADVSIESRQGVVGLAPNEELNLRFVENCRRDSPELIGLVALSTVEETVTGTMVHQIGARTLFGRDRDLDAWSVQLRHQFAVVEEWELGEGAPEEDTFRRPGREPDALLPLVLERGGSVGPIDERTRYEDGDRVTFVVNTRLRDEAKDWLAWWGWRKVEAGESKSGVWRTQVSDDERTPDPKDADA